MKNFFSKLSAIILLMVIPLVGVASIVSGGCKSTPLVITEDNNVNPDALANGNAIPVPLESLGGDLGKQLTVEMAKRGTKLVITSQSNLLDRPNAIVVYLDRKVTESLLSPELLNFLGATLEGVPVIGPWAKLLIGASTLLIPNVRGNVFNAAKRIIPGLQGPNNDGRIPDVTDIRESLVDIAKALTLASPQSAQIHT